MSRFRVYLQGLPFKIVTDCDSLKLILVNLFLSQGRDSEIRKLRHFVEKAEHKLFEMRNGLFHRKHDKDLLFSVPTNTIIHVIRKCHNEMGHFSIQQTCGAIGSTFWFPKIKERVIALNPCTEKPRVF